MASQDTPPADTNYQVVARRFRPQTWGEMVGQDDVLHSLRAALHQHRIPHAFLFSGSRGVGKTTSARILARCLNCEQGPTADPCGTCELCRSILEGHNPDVIEIDAASNNSVEDVRQLREHAAFATMRSKWRVIILDEVHMLSKGAFNALLKTLEEPPPGVVFVLATTELHKVPETIRSRCQVLMFRRVGEPDLVKRLQSIAAREGLTIADDILGDIAASVRGGVRDAETALERVLPLVREMGAAFDLAAYRSLVSRVGTDAVVEVVGSLLQGDARKGLHFARDLARQGIDEREALGEVVEVLRWLLLLHVDGPGSVLVPLAGALRERLVGLLPACNAAQLDAMITAGLLGRERLRRLEDRGAVLEVAMVRMAQAGVTTTVAELLAEVRAGGFAAGGGVAAMATAPNAARPAPGAAQSPIASGRDLKARVLEVVRDKQLLHGTLSLCEFAEPDGRGVVVVSIRSERRMYLDRFQSPDVQRDTLAALRDVLGPSANAEFRNAGAGAPNSGQEPGSGAPAAAAAEVKPGSAARRALDRFGGRVVAVNPEDGVRKPSAAAPDREPDPEAPPPEGD